MLKNLPNCTCPKSAHTLKGYVLVRYPLIVAIIMSFSLFSVDSCNNNIFFISQLLLIDL